MSQMFKTRCNVNIRKYRSKNKSLVDRFGGVKMAKSNNIEK